jgi:hypothetical protein
MALKIINPFVIKMERNIRRRIIAILSASLSSFPDFSPNDFEINLQNLL